MVHYCMELMHKVKVSLVFFVSQRYPHGAVTGKASRAVERMRLGRHTDFFSDFPAPLSDDNPVTVIMEIP